MTAFAMASEAEQAESLQCPSESHRSVPAPFLTKTYQIVDEASTDDIVSWGEDDATFVVWKPMEFARDLLPKFFKHNNFSSFVRQLNTYGFRKVVPDRWEFANEHFRRRQKHLLCDISRRKTTSASATAAAASTAGLATSPSPNSSSEETQPALKGARTGLCSEVDTGSSLEDDTTGKRSPMFTPAFPVPSSQPASSPAVALENERLKRENLLLVSELTRLRRLYDDIMMFLSHHSQMLMQGVPAGLPPPVPPFFNGLSPAFVGALGSIASAYTPPGPAGPKQEPPVNDGSVKGSSWEGNEMRILSQAVPTYEPGALSPTLGQGRVFAAPSAHAQSTPAAEPVRTAQPVDLRVPQMFDGSTPSCSNQQEGFRPVTAGMRAVQKSRDIGATKMGDVQQGVPGKGLATSSEDLRVTRGFQRLSGGKEGSQEGLRLFGFTLQESGGQKRSLGGSRLPTDAKRLRVKC